MELGIKNRFALVTGASRSIGKAIAKNLAEERVKLILVARSETGLKSVIEEIRKDSPADHCYVAADLQTPEGMQSLFSFFKEKSIMPEIIVHNLGGSLGVTQPFCSSDEWKKVWHFNVGIGHDINSFCIPTMLEKKWGRIVHISTLATSTYNAYPAYTAAKCALDGYVKCISRQLSKDNVIMNALAPGLVYLEGRYFSNLLKENPEAVEKYYDEHLPIRRMAQADEIGKAVAFLCSEHAAYMPGAIVRVDGGGN